MAKKINSFDLNLDTIIEVVAIKGNKAIKKVMTIKEANKMTKKRGWNYYRFQLGYSQFNNL